MTEEIYYDRWIEGGGYEVLDPEIYHPALKDAYSRSEYGAVSVKAYFVDDVGNRTEIKGGWVEVNYDGNRRNTPCTIRVDPNAIYNGSVPVICNPNLAGFEKQTQRQHVKVVMGEITKCEFTWYRAGGGLKDDKKNEDTSNDVNKDSSKEQITPVIPKETAIKIPIILGVVAIIIIAFFVARRK